jgi:hypothetical protein
MHDDALDRALQTDSDFFRALIRGVAIGAPAAWIVLTGVFAATTSSGWLTAAGYSALPAVFCGPFIGGLFTTTLVTVRAQHASAEAAAPAAAPKADDEVRGQAA